MDWLRSTPFGFRKLLNYIYKRYKTPIFMTENVRVLCSAAHSLNL